MGFRSPPRRSAGGTQRERGFALLGFTRHWGTVPAWTLCREAQGGEGPADARRARSATGAAKAATFWWRRSGHEPQAAGPLRLLRHHRQPPGAGAVLVCVTAVWLHSQVAFSGRRTLAGSCWGGAPLGDGSPDVVEVAVPPLAARSVDVDPVRQPDRAPSPAFAACRAQRPSCSYTVARGAGCPSWARQDLWEPGAGDPLGHPAASGPAQNSLQRIGLEYFRPRQDSCHGAMADRPWRGSTFAHRLALVYGDPIWASQNSQMVSQLPRPEPGPQPAYRHEGRLANNESATATGPTAVPREADVLSLLACPTNEMVLSLVRCGLPFVALEKLVAAVGSTQKEVASALGIPPTTLSRRRRGGRLTPVESDHVIRIARLTVMARSLMAGDPIAAQRWFTTRHPVLGDETPLRRASTETGGREVEDLIGRLRHGVFS